MNSVTITRIPGLRSVQSFRDYIDKLGIDLRIEDSIVQGNGSPLAKPLKWNDRIVGNSWCVHPMEGWDGTTTGDVTEPMIRRWRNFGASGAKLIWGGEAMAVRPEGRANPNQLIINEANKKGLAQLRETLLVAHQEGFGRTDDLVIGFQLTHFRTVLPSN